MAGIRVGNAFCFSVAFLLAFEVARADPQVPILEMRVVPSVLNVGQPCPTTTTVDVLFRNNGLVNAINVDWTSAYVAHNPNCVADYAPKNGTVNNIPAQGVMSVTITLSFIGACDGLTTINFQGTIPGSNPVDSDSKVLTVKCNTPVVGFCTPNVYGKGGVCLPNVTQAECTAEGGIWNETACVPTVSEWGLVVMTLLVLTAATVVIMRRRAAVA